MPSLGQYADHSAQCSARNQLGSRMGIQLTADAFSVITDCGGTEIQNRRNLFRGFSQADQVKNLLLTSGKQTLRHPRPRFKICYLRLAPKSLIAAADIQHSFSGESG